MARHLTDKEKKKIIADYAVCENYSAVARKYGVSVDTIKRTVLRDPATTKKTMEKKAENTADILAYMDTQKGEVIGLMSDYLKALRDPDKIDKAGVQPLAIAMGIVIDKYTISTKNDEALRKLDDVLDRIGGVV